MSKQASELFIVDNSDSDWKVRSYPKYFCELYEARDIATGHFEIGALLALEENWQAVGQLRILMGDEVSLRTKLADDIAHYQRSVVALNETMRLKAEIDQVIEAHGGWPYVFAINTKAGGQK
jgi:hypothetical protein